jgi:hypothetical protein
VVSKFCLPFKCNLYRYRTGRSTRVSAASVLRRGPTDPTAQVRRRGSFESESSPLEPRPFPSMQCVPLKLIKI